MPSRYHHIPLYTLLLMTCLVTCRQPYNPPVITQPNRFLVVDGFINADPNTITTFKLNRTRNLGDSTVIGIAELNAQASIIGSNGVSYPLIDRNRSGTYSSDPLTLDVTQQYSISITTADGEKFSSDQTPCEISPPIDSIFWQQPFDLSIYISTHDPTNQTHYYRYDYNETWEHDSQLQSVYTVVNGTLVATDSSNQTARCWSTDTSTNILLATSSALSNDVISGFNLTTITNSDPRLQIDYSIIVRQYALTADAYNYWQLIQKTTQNVGTLFDLQPTQLMGNIHCTTNPAEPVIGYISATTVQQQRILIFESSLHDWMKNQPSFTCDTMTITVPFANPFAYNYPNPYWAPYYFADETTLVLTTAACLNCTLFGGTTVRPPFMPD